MCHMCYPSHNAGFCVTVFLQASTCCSYVLELYVFYVLYSEFMGLCMQYVLPFMQCWLAREKFLCAVFRLLSLYYTFTCCSYVLEYVLYSKFVSLCVLDVLSFSQC